MPQQPYQAGWACPSNSRKWHYFWQGRSLCGRWGFFGRLWEMFASAKEACAECRRRHEAGEQR